MACTQDHPGAVLLRMAALGGYRDTKRASLSSRTVLPQKVSTMIPLTFFLQLYLTRPSLNRRIGHRARIVHRTPSFKRIMIAPVRHHVLLHVRVEGFLHPVHVLGVVLLGAFRFR